MFMIKFIRAAAAIMLMTMVVITTSCRKITGGGVELTTYTPQDITNTTAVCGCEVVAEQGVELTEIGVCWSENKSPTFADSHLSTWDCDEPFMTTITDLKPNTLYHVRAYALRDSEYFYYGMDKSFFTKAQGHGSDTDKNPVISINADRTAIPSGETVAVTIQAHANASTQKDIRTVKFDVVHNGENVYTDTFEVNAATYSNVIELRFTGSEGDTFEVSATATDIVDKTATATVTITIDVGALLLVERPFEWFRYGGEVGYGLAEFGLEWRSNQSKAVYAVIKPVADAKLYKLTTSAYEAATTESEKQAAFEGLTEISQWKEFNVAGASTQTLDKVLGTFYQGKYHLIHITNGTCTAGNYGMDVTISGMAK